MTPELVKELRDQKAREIAYRIVVELVCCDVYDRVKRGEEISREDMHEICHWGGYAAHIAIEDLDETLEEVLDGFNRQGNWPVAPYQREEKK